MRDFSRLIIFLTDNEAEIFAISKKEYLDSPATLIDAIRIYKKRILDKKRENANSK